MEQILLHLEHILFFFYDIYFQRYYQKTIGILILVDEHNQAERWYAAFFLFRQTCQMKVNELEIAEHGAISIKISFRW